MHMGDWGLQMGLVITEMKERYPDLVYFDESFDGEYPEEAPVTVTELRGDLSYRKQEVQGRSGI